MGAWWMDPEWNDAQTRYGEIMAGIMTKKVRPPDMFDVILAEVESAKNAPPPVVSINGILSIFTPLGGKPYG